jgi:hypothetical protein
LTPSASPAIPDDLEAAFRRYMADGIPLTGDVRSFMTATFGDASADTLQTLLSDESSAERDSLLDLVFFPDQALQLAIEPVLERHGLTEEAVRLIAARLKAAPVATGLRLPGVADLVPTVMPAFLVDAFLARLNLTWQPAAVLIELMPHLDTRLLSPTHDREDGRLRLRVHLRNAGLRQTPAQVLFLCDFFERVSFDDKEFVDKLDFMLVFLREHEGATHFYQALMDRKKFLFRHLLKNRQTTEWAARTNMETRIMAGVRPSYFDVHAAERSLALIDRIAMAVFGRTEWLDGSPRSVDLGNYTGAPDPAELVDRLS